MTWFSIALLIGVAIYVRKKSLNHQKKFDEQVKILRDVVTEHQRLLIMLGDGYTDLQEVLDTQDNTTEKGDLKDGLPQHCD